MAVGLIRSLWISGSSTPREGISPAQGVKLPLPTHPLIETARLLFSATNQTITLDGIRAIPFFEGCSEDELAEIQRLTSDLMVDRYSSLIKAGGAERWTSVITSALKTEGGYKLILAAHAAGKINPHELATALMFMNGAAESPNDWKIHPLDPTTTEGKEQTKKFHCEKYFEEMVPPNLRFHISYKSTYTVDPSSFYYISNLKRVNDQPLGYIHLPSFASVQATLKTVTESSDNYQILVPIWKISDRKKMIQRLHQQQSDVAFTAPGEGLFFHGSVKYGVYTLSHDYGHALIRSLTNSLAQWIKSLKLVDLLEAAMDKMMPYKHPLLVNNQDSPLISSNASKEEQARWVLDRASGKIVDGFLQGFEEGKDLHLAIKTYLTSSLADDARGDTFDLRDGGFPISTIGPDIIDRSMQAVAPAV